MDQIFAIKFAYLIPLLPMAGAVIAGFFGARLLRGLSHWPIWIGVGLAALMSLSMLPAVASMVHVGGPAVWTSIDWYTWIDARDFQATFGCLIDPLSVVMLCVVTGVGFFITVFSAGYMKGEPGYFRFFAYLGLFIFSMTCLVMANNFVMLYLGWEGVGLCSYLLIGYYYERPAAREAAKKAFLVNRVGDFGFGLGIMLIWKAFGTVSFMGQGAGTGVFDMAQQAIAQPHAFPFQYQCLQYIPFLLMMGAFGKSAQFPLHVWLPDAMEGPTPVSALIHAATMVTAGIYMIARCSVLFVSNPIVLLTVACVGTFTAFFAATIALRQFDLKRVFAYSTISQLGFMFAGVGMLAPVAGVYHLITHAFFKALLFLSCGVVMHAMSGELDMRKMSGLRRVLPKTNIVILVGCLALAGFFPFSGFFSKDEIVGAAFHRSPVLGLVLLVAAFMTAYYTFRLYFRVFWGPLVVPPPPQDAHGSHDDHGHHNHEPAVMILPLFVLAAGALLAGFINWPTPYLARFLGASPSLQGAYSIVQTWGSVTSPVLPEGMGQMAKAGQEEGGFSLLMFASALISAAGILLAWWLHLRDRARAGELAGRLGSIVRILDAKYWVDEIYQRGIVDQLRGAGFSFFGFDQFLDKLVDAVGMVPQVGGALLRGTMQRGYLQGYAAAMLLGLAAILWFIFAS